MECSSQEKRGRELLDTRNLVRKHGKNPKALHKTDITAKKNLKLRTHIIEQLMSTFNIVL